MKYWIRFLFINSIIPLDLRFYTLSQPLGSTKIDTACSSLNKGHVVLILESFEFLSLLIPPLTRYLVR